MGTLKNKYDSTFFGLISGIIIPLVFLGIFYLQVYFKKLEFITFLGKIWETNIFSPLISLCCIGNLGLFFLFYYLHFNYAARGTIISTFFYAICIVILKVI